VLTLDGGDSVVYLGGNATKAGELRILEDSDAGTNYVAIKAQNMGASYTLTLPADDGCACEVLTTNGSGTLTWAAAGGISGLGSTDNVILRANGTGGATAQGSAVTITDANVIQAGNGCATTPTYSFSSNTNLGMYRAGADLLNFATGGTERIRLKDALFNLGDTLNGSMNTGININQGAYDNEIFALKSSDVAHGTTSVTETDTFGVFSKVAATPGGLRICGLVDTANNIAVEIRGLSTGGVDTTKDCGSAAYISIKAGLKCGTGFGALGANQNIFAVRNNTTTRFIIDEDGDLFADGGTTTDAVTVFDEYCDAQLARTFTQVIDSSGGSGLIDNRWDDFIKYNECTLIDLDLLGGPRIGVGPGGKKGLINYTGMVRLHSGAIWQLHSKLADQQEEITALKGQLQALTGGK